MEGDSTEQDFNCMDSFNLDDSNMEDNNAFFCGDLPLDSDPFFDTTLGEMDRMKSDLEKSWENDHSIDNHLDLDTVMDRTENDLEEPWVTNTGINDVNVLNTTVGEGNQILMNDLGEPWVHDSNIIDLSLSDVNQEEVDRMMIDLEVNNSNIADLPLLDISLGEVDKIINDLEKPRVNDSNMEGVAKNLDMDILDDELFSQDSSQSCGHAWVLEKQDSREEKKITGAEVNPNFEVSLSHSSLDDLKNQQEAKILLEPPQTDSMSVDALGVKSIEMTHLLDMMEFDFSQTTKLEDIQPHSSKKVVQQPLENIEVEAVSKTPSTNTSELMKCKDCKMTFTFIDDLFIHQLFKCTKSQDSRDGKYMWSCHCTESFRSSLNYNVHMEDKHDMKQCVHCGAMVSSTNELALHEKRVHSKVSASSPTQEETPRHNYYECCHCGVAFFNKAILKSHYWNQHRYSVKLEDILTVVAHSLEKCRICDIIIIKQKRKSENILIPTVKYDSVCIFCLKFFGNHEKLKAHWMEVHDFQECPQCKVLLPSEDKEPHVNEEHHTVSQMSPMALIAHNHNSKCKMRNFKNHVHGKSHKCCVCRYGYCSSEILRKHYRLDHRITLPKSFILSKLEHTMPKCKICQVLNVELRQTL